MQTPTTTPAGSHHARTAWTIVGIVIATLALAVVVFAATVAFTVWRRRRRRRHDRDPRRRVLGAWAEALDQLRTAGVPPRPSATALEFALRYAPAHGAGDAGPALMELAQLQSAAMYASEPPSDADATAAWEQVDTIRETIRAQRRPLPPLAENCELAKTGVDPEAGPSRRVVRAIEGRRSEPQSYVPESLRRSTNAARSASKARTSASTSAAT